MALNIMKPSQTRFSQTLNGFYEFLGIHSSMLKLLRDLRREMGSCGRFAFLGALAPGKPLKMELLMCLLNILIENSTRSTETSDKLYFFV